MPARSAATAGYPAASPLIRRERSRAGRKTWLAKRSRPPNCVGRGATPLADEEAARAVLHAVLHKIPFDHENGFIRRRVAVGRDRTSGRDPRHHGHAASRIKLLE